MKTELVASAALFLFFHMSSRQQKHKNNNKKENLHTFRTHTFIHARRDFKSTNYLKLFSYTLLLLLLLLLLSVCFSEFSRFLFGLFLFCLWSKFAW